MDERHEFDEKMTAFLATHQRILGDFGRSLANARHFLKLADRSLQREPEETVSMLEQIREIDLLGHLTRQYEEYRNVTNLLLPPHGSHPDPRLQGDLAELQTRYEGLLEEAAGQMEISGQLLTSLQTRH
jgi:hypothetical protein